MTNDGMYNKFTFDYFYKHGRQPFQLLKESFYTVPSGFVSPKRRYFIKAAIDPAIQQIFETGIYLKIMSEYVPPEGESNMSASF